MPCKLKKIHLIAQSHIDPAFMWDQNEGISCILNTTNEAIRKLTEFPMLAYSSSSAELLDLIARIQPELLERIRQAIRSGRFYSSGAWYVEADTMLSGGETLIRQALVGRQVERECGLEPSKTLFLLDSFGHPCCLPKILAHCGIDNLIISRPNNKQLPLDFRLFYFESEDGSRVKTFRIPIGYSTYSDEVERVGHIMEVEADSAESMCFFGIGDHGGGPTTVQVRRMLDFIDRNRGTDGPEIVFGTPEDFFAHNSPSRQQVFRGMLEPSMVGCYSTTVELKRCYDMALQKLLQAERAAVFSQQATDLRSAWKKLLSSGFHDYLPGTAVIPALQRVVGHLQGIIAQADQARERSYHHFARSVNTAARDGYVKFIVINDTPVSGRFYPQYEPWLFWQSWDKYQVVDENDREIAVQRIHSQAAAPAIPRLIIPLHLEAFSYRFLRVLGPDADLDNLAVKEDGSREMASCEIADLPESLPRFEFLLIDDHSDSWSIKIRSYPSRGKRFKVGKNHAVENGPIRFAYRQELKYRKSAIRVDYFQYADSTDVEVHVKVDFREERKLLKMVMPLDFAPTAMERGESFGKAELAFDGQERVFHNFIRCRGAGNELAVIAGNGIHGVDARNGSLRFSLLRSAVYCHEELSRPYEPGMYHEIMNLGRHEFKFRICRNAAPLSDAECNHLSEALDNPPVIITTDKHCGEKPLSGKLLAVAPEHLEVCAIKFAEDGDGTVIRLLETSGRTTSGHITYSGRKFKVRVPANTIRTFKITANMNIEEVDGTENTIRLQK